MIYGYQKEAYQKLFRTALAHKIAMDKKLPVRPRFHKLVVGPSGSGKTHLAKRVADILNWRVLVLNMAGWVVLGARETPTWHTIGEWLSETHPDEPQMIILDEIDKVSGNDSWTRYLRAEVYSLVDGLVPPQVIPNHMDNDNFSDSIRQTLIFGCGAFQDAFEVKPTAGFNSTLDYPTMSNDLAKHLQRELVNRFDSEIIILPELQINDYKKMIDDTIPELPEDIAKIVKKISPKLIDEAITNKTGARFMENVLSAAYLENVDVVMDMYEKFEKEEQEQQEKETDEVIKLSPEEAEALAEEIIEGLWTVRPNDDKFTNL